MVDVASITIAAISLAGTVLLGFLNFGLSWSVESLKRYSESLTLIAKYRDPLLLAADDLQSRLYNLLDGDMTDWINDPRGQDNSRLYTAFLVGQYLSWTYILRRKAQFLRFASSSTDRNRRLTEKVADITETFSSNSDKELEGAQFNLWRGQQIAIGEIMTIKEDDELYSLGYAEFVHKYKNVEDSDKESVKNELELVKNELERGTKDAEEQHEPSVESQDFKKWFRPIIESINRVATAKVEKSPVNDQRMRILQHLFLDLRDLLDEKGRVSGIRYKNRCHRAKSCICESCKSSSVCPCASEYKIHCPWADPGSRPKESV